MNDVDDNESMRSNLLKCRSSPTEELKKKKWKKQEMKKKNKIKVEADKLVMWEREINQNCSK